MKKVLILFSLMICFGTYAQRHGANDRAPRKDRMEKPDFTPEQIAELRVKELTLLLDLSEVQQKQIKEIELTAATERKAQMEQGEKPESQDDGDRFEKRSEMLDKQLAMKNSMKNILSEEQFKKWEKSHKQRGLKRHHKKHHGKHPEKKK